MNINPKLFILPSNEVSKYGLENLTYGSLTIKGINLLVKTIKKYKCNNIYGFDIGCGDGELIYQINKLIPESKWEGVEISDHRINCQERDVHIWQGDILDENLREYNVIHVDNLCFDDVLENKLEEKVIREFNGLYITYRKPINNYFIKNSIFLESVDTETTWDSHIIHYYFI